MVAAPVSLENRRQQQDEHRKAPNNPGEWTLAQIQFMLKRPLPESYLASKPVGKGNNKRQVFFIPWHRANNILDKYAPGWTWEIVTMQATGDRLFVTGRLTIPTAEGNIYREASGTEELNCSGYGDPSSNAESMAFRRAAARFGLGLYLYEG